MNKVKTTGYAVMATAALAEVFYILWFFGYIPNLDEELAVKIPVLIITSTLLLILAFLGYVMVTTEQPITIKPTKQSY